MAETEETFQVTPTKFIYGGEALARLPDGRAVFVPYALPDEEVRIRVTEDKERYARGEIVEVLDPSPERTEPTCLHFGRCGGCHYQHMPYPAQLQAKENILRDQLQRIGGLSDPPVRETVPSPSPWHYRNHIQFHVTESGELGYKEFRSDRIFAVQECHLPEEVIDLIWPVLDVEHIPGLDRVRLRSGEQEDDVVLVLESSDPAPIEFQVDLPVSAVHQGPGGEMVLSGDDFTIIDVHGFPFVVSTGSFFQTNIALTELLVDHVYDLAEPEQEMTVLDVYSGVGLFSVFFAREVKRVIGVESSPSAADDYMHNLSEFENVELYEAAAEEVLPHLELQPEIILVDPPRAGLDPAALDGILHLVPAALIYVSCDPATLARDAKRLHKGGFEMKECTPFDMFPQTYHIESVSLFTSS